MNERKATQEQYIQFLIASQGSFSSVEAARVQQQTAGAPAHDSFTRLLSELEPDPARLWLEAEPLIDKAAEGILVLDDSTLDKPHARHIELVGWHFSGKHKEVVKGINLVTLLWTDGDRHVPVDYRIYKKGGPTKNDLFREMLLQAHARGLAPRCVCFDSWYASVENLKAIRGRGWTFLTRLKRNRRVRQGLERVRLEDAVVPEAGAVLSLTGYGPVKVFRADPRDGDAEPRHWATNDEGMRPLGWLRWAEWSWRIEEYHRGLKQHCGAEGCQARSEKAQRNHIGMSIRAFVRLPAWCWGRWSTWFEANTDIVGGAVRAYLASPWITLEACASPPLAVLPLNRCA